MPCYSALALLLGSAMAIGGDWIRRATRVLCAIALLASITTFGIFVAVRHVPAPGDISQALSSHPGAYRLSLGHMLDLTFNSFAYLRLPLLLASLAFLVGAIGTLRWLGQRSFLSTALMMIVFFHAARLALVVFDPYLSSRPLAEAIREAPVGQLIVNRHYYTFSSIFFYLGRDAFLLNGKRLNLEYGAAAPDAPPAFIDDTQFQERWSTRDRYYFVAEGNSIPAVEGLVGREKLNVVDASGGKFVLTNQPFPGTIPLATFKTSNHSEILRNADYSGLGARSDGQVNASLQSRGNT